MSLGKACAGWGSIFLSGFPCYISLAVLEQDDSFFTALLIHLGRDAGFFLKAQMKTSSSCTQDQREARYSYNFPKQDWQGSAAEQTYFKICINNSWLPCKVVSVRRAKVFIRQREMEHKCCCDKNVPALESGPHSPCLWLLQGEKGSPEQEGLPVIPRGM